jgi:membrane protease YdiL (CAAX protease family)
VQMPTPAPRLAQALKLGLWTVCIALVFATPLAIAWTFLLNALTGETPGLQGLVQTALNPDATYEPWLIAGFGVLIAPFAEEALFRGMLYPALRSALARFRGAGDTPLWVARRAMWVSAVVVSALFAAVHGNALAMAPLFALAMVLTWIFEKTNSLAACVFAHAVHNALSMVPLLFLRSL